GRGVDRERGALRAPAVAQRPAPAAARGCARAPGNRAGRGRRARGRPARRGPAAGRRRRAPAMNVPNLLTGMRLLGVPVFVYLFLQGFHRAALAVFIGALVTDWLDGVLARALKQFTDLGALLDPIADKLMALSSLS